LTDRRNGSKNKELGIWTTNSAFSGSSSVRIWLFWAIVPLFPTFI
jgi:hypothetical protein